MVELKKTLDAKGHCLLEMPSGTGKTVTILAFIISYQQVHPDRAKLIYCSRTVPEIEKALLELKRLIAFRERESGKKMDFLGIGLSSRKNLCINKSVNYEKNGKVVDGRCHSLTASWVRSKAQVDKSTATCDYFETLENAGKPLNVPSGVYTLDDIKEFGETLKFCPYFLSRSLLTQANVIIYSYYYLLDPKISELVSREMSKNCVIIFDEAHNIGTCAFNSLDNVCIESMSVDLNRVILDSSTRSLQKLTDKIQEIKDRDGNRLKEEYNRLVEGLRRAQQNRMTDQILANPILPDEVLDEAVPGNIRKAEHFVAMLRRFIEHLKTKLKIPNVVTESPMAFLQNLKEATFIDRKPLRFTAERLSSLVRTLELSNLEEFSSLQRVANFATILSSYLKGFTVIMEPFDNQAPSIPNPVLHLCCLDASLAIKPVFQRFETVVITSGTLSPLEMYPKMLSFSPVILKSFPMTLARNCFSPMIVTRGSDQIAITSKFEVRNDPGVVRNYGNLLVEFSKIVPDGLVCFFPSYIYMESIITLWNDMGILNEVLKYKLIFVETPDALETSLALSNYREACCNGRGGVLFSVARGKVSEGIDFDHHYGRAVIMFGIPYQNTESRILKARLEYLREQYHIKESDFLTFDAIRHAAQCVGRVLRGKSDYGLMVLADKRFLRADKRSKLPKWINANISEANSNLSVDMALNIARVFYRKMGQPFDINDYKGASVWSLEDVCGKEQERRDGFELFPE